jgi:DNA-3-methyladenine glycosylase II
MREPSDARRFNVSLSETDNCPAVHSRLFVQNRVIAAEPVFERLTRGQPRASDTGNSFRVVETDDWLDPENDSVWMPGTLIHRRRVLRGVADAHDHLRTTDLAPLVEEHGELTVEPADDFFERFVTSIVSQQVSTASARAIEERLFEAVEVTPAGILSADESVLRDAGLSGQKVRYVGNVAEAFREHGYSHAYFAEMDDEAVVAELTEITGVGQWTAEMQLMFSLGREDVFPVGDLGIRKGMQELYGDISREEMVVQSEAWRPYRSYASRYLWRLTDD